MVTFYLEISSHMLEGRKNHMDWDYMEIKEELKFKLSKDGKVSTVGTTESKHLPWHSINTSLLYTF